MIVFFISVLLISIIGAQSQIVEQPPVLADHDGRPGCQTRYEFKRLWRNNLIPDQYWECTRWQERAEVRYCPMATRFQDSWQTCVPFNQWTWTPYIEPPTRAGVLSPDECVEIVISEPEECHPATPTTASPVTTESASTTNTESTEKPTDTTTTEEPEGETEAPGNTQCVGASASQHSEGTLECSREPPSNSCTIFSINRRVATPDPYVYFECNLRGWVQRECSGNQCFDNNMRSCVSPLIWRNRCQLE